MKTVLMPFAGAQSCGSKSMYQERDTATEPSKGQVVGMVCSAMGIAREDTANIARIAALRMGVRVDVEGIPQSDFCSAGGGSFGSLRPVLSPSGIQWIDYGVCKADGSLDPDPSKRISITTKHYLADAFFLVALEGDDKLVEQIYDFLGHPVYGLSLGRKCFKSVIPMKMPDGLVSVDIETAFKQSLWLPDRLIPPLHYKRLYWVDNLRRKAEQFRLRTVIEIPCPRRLTRGIEQRFDVPISFVQADRLTTTRNPRFVLLGRMDPPERAKEKK